MYGNQITLLDDNEIATAVESISHIFSDNGLLDEKNNADINLLDPKQWLTNEGYDKNWIREFSEIVSKQWNSTSMAGAVSAVFDEILTFRGAELAMLIAECANDKEMIQDLTDTLHKAVPGFTKDFPDTQQLSPDTLFRAAILNVLNADPKNSADAVLVDAAARKYQEFYDVDAIDVIEAASSVAKQMPIDAIGFALVLEGCRGFKKVWLKEPKQEDAYFVKTIAEKFRDYSKSTEIEDEYRASYHKAAISICTHNSSAYPLNHLLGVVSNTLDMRGMIIIVDPLAEDEIEAIAAGVLQPVEGDTIFQIYEDIMMRPSVYQFIKNTELFEEIKASFNTRLLETADEAIY